MDSLDDQEELIKKNEMIEEDQEKCNGNHPLTLNKPHPHGLNPRDV